MLPPNKIDGHDILQSGFAILAKGEKLTIHVQDDDFIDKIELIVVVREEDTKKTEADIDSDDNMIVKHIRKFENGAMSANTGVVFEKSVTGQRCAFRFTVKPIGTSENYVLQVTYVISEA